MTRANSHVFSVLLGLALHKTIKMEDLIPRDALIRLSRTMEAPGSAVLAVYASEPVGAIIAPNDGVLVAGQHATAIANEGPDGRLAIGGLVPDRIEASTARKLGVSPELVAETAYRLWSCSMSENRDRLVAERAAPDSDEASKRATSGRITRVLMSEVEQYIKTTRGKEIEVEDQG